MSASKVLVILTGSIACFKSCELISRLVKQGHIVQCVATNSALNFVGEATLEGLTGHSVAKSTFTNGQMMDHIYLARWADLVIACPTSANSLNKWSQGIADDLASTLFLAFDRPDKFFIVPAMNSKMYEHPITQNSIKKLKDYGYNILPTKQGELACGEFGLGRMLEVDEIYQSIFKPKKFSALVTAGGTVEPIDGVRSITNTSTGKTALKLAEAIRQKGGEVNYLRAKLAPAFDDTKDIEFTSFKNLQKKLFQQLKNNKFDFIFHAAAVSDYSVAFINSRPASEHIKINSTEEQIDLTLTKNPKLIEHIKKISPHSIVIGFKLTKTHIESERIEAIKKLTPYVDYIVHNDMNEIQTQKHKFTLYNKNTQLIAGNLKSVTEILNYIKLNNQEQSHDLMS